MSLKFSLFLTLLNIIAISNIFSEINYVYLQNYNPENAIKLHYFSRRNPNISRRIEYGDTQILRRIDLTGDKLLKILIHGWGTNAHHESNILIRDAFLIHFDANIIVVDWSTGMQQYPADSLAMNVGVFLGRTLDWLVDSGVPLDKIHIVAHSLGSQVAGVAGRHCRRGKISYITALDPPGGTWEDSVYCLNRNDAQYVEVIHTFISGTMLLHPAGHTDFYPNGGFDMPGCENDFWCSHGRAYEYYAESINSAGCTANQCISFEEILNKRCTSQNKLTMGGSYPKNVTGLFYTRTNSQKPYCPYVA